jgi:hypothetical protein
MLHLRRRFQLTIMSVVAGTTLACMGSVAFASASLAGTVTFNYTGADVSYTIPAPTKLPCTGREAAAWPMTRA